LAARDFRSSTRPELDEPELHELEVQNPKQGKGKRKGRELVRGMTTRGQGVDTRHGPEKIRAYGLGDDTRPVVLFHRQDHVLENVYVPAVAYTKSNSVFGFANDGAAQRNPQLARGDL